MIPRLDAMIDPARDARRYRLSWPASLLRRELLRLIFDSPTYPLLRRRACHLLGEAFESSKPVDDFDAFVRQHSGATWPDTPHPEVLAEYLDGLADAVEDMPSGARQYFVQRHDAENTAPATVDAHRALRHGWAALVTALDEHGYFDDFAGSSCPDSPESDQRQGKMSTELGRHLGGTLPWPPAPGSVEHLTDAELFTAMEVLVDLVARPRIAEPHYFHEGYDYADFDSTAGEDVYLWRVNELLASYAPNYRMIEEGPQRGEIATTANDGRDDLLPAVLAHTSPADGNHDRVRHAIELYRGRSASVEDKRSAIRDLGDVLEHRRKLLQNQLTNTDAGALFNVLNGFGIRHHNADQKTNYPKEEFLDWIYWNALSTVELTNRLLENQRDAPA